jgi:hypothetical protein
VTALFTVDAAAAADPPPDPSDSALAQYVEQIPTSSGPKAVSQAGGQAAGQPLPASSESELRKQGGNDAKLLEEIATSPALGAPERGSSSKRASEPKSAQRAPSAGSEAVGPSESTASELISGRVLGLLAVLGAVTLAAGLFAASRRRSADN